MMKFHTLNWSLKCNVFESFPIEKSEIIENKFSQILSIPFISCTQWQFKYFRDIFSGNMLAYLIKSQSGLGILILCFTRTPWSELVA